MVWHNVQVMVGLTKQCSPGMRSSENMLAQPPHVVPVNYLPLLLLLSCHVGLAQMSVRYNEAVGLAGGRKEFSANIFIGRCASNGAGTHAKYVHAKISACLKYINVR